MNFLKEVIKNVTILFLLWNSIPPVVKVRFGFWVLIIIRTIHHPAFLGNILVNKVFNFSYEFGCIPNSLFNHSVSHSGSQIFILHPSFANEVGKMKMKT